MDSYDELKALLGRINLREIARRMETTHVKLQAAEYKGFTPDQALHFELAVRSIATELLSFQMPAHRILQPVAVELPDGTELARKKVTVTVLTRPSEV